MNYKRKGGLHFLRLGRLSISFCIASAHSKRAKTVTRRHELELKRQATLAALRGDDLGRMFAADYARLPINR